MLNHEQELIIHHDTRINEMDDENEYILHRYDHREDHYNKIINYIYRCVYFHFTRSYEYLFQKQKQQHHDQMKHVE